MLLKTEDCFSKVSSDTIISKKLPKGFYTFDVSKELGVHMRLEEDPDLYRLPKRLFGDVVSRKARIINTWKTVDKNTGVLLSGTKGTGKSLLLKSCVNQLLREGFPVINFSSVLADSPDPQLRIIENTKQPTVLVIDEVEKVLSPAPWQERLLTFLDGTYDGRLLTIMTANDVNKIEDTFFNRPGRIRYNWKYNGLENSVVSDVVKHTLKNKKWTDETIRVLCSIEEVTFDIVSAVVEEMNIYGVSVDEALRPMNINKVPKAGFSVV